MATAATMGQMELALPGGEILSVGLRRRSKIPMHSLIPTHKTACLVAIFVVLARPCFFRRRDTAEAAVQYSVTDMGTLGGTYSHALAINTGGQIVGHADHPPDGMDHTYRTLPN